MLDLDEIRRARTLFVDPCRLDTRWQGLSAFTVVDTFFDAGQRFLATVAAWKDDSHASEYLHYVAFDPKPTDQEALFARWQPLLDHYGSHQHLSDQESGSAAREGIPAASVAPAIVQEDRRLLQLIRAFIDDWPHLMVNGVRTFVLAHANVTLTLAVGETLALARNMRLRADAFYLPGCSAGGIGRQGNDEHSVEPSPGLLCKALAKMAAVGAPMATYAPAGTAYSLSAAMSTAGFTVEDEVKVHPAAVPDTTASAVKGSRSAMPSVDRLLLAHFAPRWRVRRHPPPPALRKSTNVAEKTALVIGAGMAGCHVVERLVHQGWHVILIDHAGGPAAGASGNRVGVFHPMITADEGFAARLSRSGFIHALARWQALEEAGYPLRWSPTGLLQQGSIGSDDDGGVDRDKGAERAKAPQVSTQPAGLPDTMVHRVDAEAVHTLSGLDTPADATKRASSTHENEARYEASWLFKQGGWIDPVSLCQALLAAARGNLTEHFNQHVDRLEHRAGRWHALDEDGHDVAVAKIVVLANAHDAQRLAGLQHVNMDNIRGQLTYLPSFLLPGLTLPVVGSGYLSPSPEGPVTGASYGVGDTRTELDPQEHRDNLARLAALLGPLYSGLSNDATGSNDSASAEAPYAEIATDFGLNVDTLAGRVSFRCTTRDRLPMIGALGDEQLATLRAASLTGAHAQDIPRQKNLYAAFGYGSRGLIWSALAAELLVSLIEHTPPPIETDLMDAIDPARFLLRNVRRGKLY